MLNYGLKIQNSIATVHVMHARFGHAKGMTLEQVLNRMSGARVRGIIFDASGMKKVSHSALGCLVEVFLRLERGRLFQPFGMALALCGLPESAANLVRAQGLDRVLPLFENTAAALMDPMFQVLRLRGARGVLLCAGNSARLAPLTTHHPIGMLDFLGQPMAARILQHAGQFGVQDFVLNPGHLAAQMIRFSKAQDMASLFCVTESSWQTRPYSDVATLARLQSAHAVFEGDTFVFQAHVLSDVDLAAMMDFHRATKADATLAVSRTCVPSAGDPENTKADNRASVILLSPMAAEALAKQAQRQNESQIVPALRAANMNVQIFASDHTMAAIKCGADYAMALAKSLETGAYGIAPEGTQIEESTWIEAGAQMGRGTKVLGAAFVGKGAKIGIGSQLKGSNVIGANSVVQRHSVLSNSVLMESTHVAAKTFVDHMIAGPDWAINHRFADGSLQNRAPLNGVSPVPMPKASNTLLGVGPAKIA